MLRRQPFPLRGSCDDANGGVEDAVESVAHIGLNGGAEQNDAEHYAAGLDAYLENLSVEYVGDFQAPDLSKYVK